METSWTVVAHDQCSSLGADKTPVGVDMGGSTTLLGLGRRFVMFGTDDVSLGDLNGASSHTVVTSMVSSGTPDTVHQLLIVFHHRVTWIITSTRVARVVRTVEAAIVNLVLWPDGVTC